MSGGLLSEGLSSVDRAQPGHPPWSPQPSPSVSPAPETFKKKHKIESLSPGRACRNHTNAPLLHAGRRFHQRLISARAPPPAGGETEARGEGRQKGAEVELYPERGWLCGKWGRSPGLQPRGSAPRSVPCPPGQSLREGQGCEPWGHPARATPAWSS